LSDLTQLRNTNLSETQKYLESKKFTLEYSSLLADTTEIVSFRSNNKIFQRVTILYDSLGTKSTWLTLSCEFNQFYLLKEEIDKKGFSDISDSIMLTDKNIHAKKIYMYQDKESIFDLRVFGAPPESDMFDVTICDISEYKKQ